MGWIFMRRPPVFAAVRGTGRFPGGEAGSLRSSSFPARKAQTCAGMIKEYPSPGTTASYVGEYDHMKRDTYAGGNPLAYVDSMGLAIECKTILKLPHFDVQMCVGNGQTPSEQRAKDAKRMSDKDLDKAFKNNGYKDAMI
jgi:hypothetical protein